MSHRFRFDRGGDAPMLTSRKIREGLLTEAILDANIDLTEEGTVRVALWREWERMLADLRDVGPVWSIVRNHHAVLAIQDDFPALQFSPDRQAAQAKDNAIKMSWRFTAWRRAMAFQSNCCHGDSYGVEVADRQGRIFHRITLDGTDHLAPFKEWTGMHQATGLEDDEDLLTFGEISGGSTPAREPGTLRLLAARLRPTLIRAAQRGIPFVARVCSDGFTQEARVQIDRASERHGWLVLSGAGHTLYVTSALSGLLLAEPVAVEGDAIWRLSLVDAEQRRLLYLLPGAGAECEWEQLVREFVLNSGSTQI